MTNNRRTRKNINKELMFNKIMPSYLTNTYNEYYNTLSQNSDQRNPKADQNTPDTFKIREKVMAVMDERPLVKENSDQQYQNAQTQTVPVQQMHTQQVPVQQASSAQAAPVPSIDDDKSRYINITEEILYAKLGNMIAMFKCCNCERCRQAIMLQVLNNVKPEYVYKKPSEVKEIIESNNYVDINQPIIRAILDTKSNPPHKR